MLITFVLLSSLLARSGVASCCAQGLSSPWMSSALKIEASFIQHNEQQVSEVALTLVAFGLGRRWRRVFSSFFADCFRRSLPRRSSSAFGVGGRRSSSGGSEGVDGSDVHLRSVGSLSFFVCFG